MKNNLKPIFPSKMIAQLITANAAFVTATGLPLNLLTIWMIFNRTQTEMGCYSQILFQTCCANLAGIFFNFLVQMTYFSDNGIGTSWSFGPAHFLPNPWQALCYRLNNFAGRFLTINICCLFIYRYLILNRDVTMTIGRHTCVLVIASLPTVALQICSIIAYLPTAQNEHVNASTMTKILDLENDTLANYVSPLRDTGHPLGKFVSSYSMFLNIAYYAVIVFCGLAIEIHVRRYLNSLTMIATRKVNVQMTKILIVQAILPLLSYLPSLLTNTLVLLQLSSGLIPTYIVMLSNVPVSWVVVLSPLVMLLNVKSYRSAIFQWFCVSPNSSQLVVEIKSTTHPNSSHPNSLPQQQQQQQQVQARPQPAQLQLHVQQPIQPNVPLPVAEY